MKRRLVLVADDDPDTVEAYSLLFRTRGHDVEVATDGPTVLVKAMALWPDLIVLDLVLPLMDGREVLRRLREPRGRRIPVLVLTGHAAADIVAAVLDEGADHVMIKPCEPLELCRRAEMLLNGGPAATAGNESPADEREAGRMRAPKPRYRARLKALAAVTPTAAADLPGRTPELWRATAALHRQARALRRQARLAYARAVAIRNGQATCWGWRTVLAATAQRVSE